MYRRSIERSLCVCSRPVLLYTTRKNYTSYRACKLGSGQISDISLPQRMAMANSNKTKRENFVKKLQKLHSGALDKGVARADIRTVFLGQDSTKDRATSSTKKATKFGSKKLRRALCVCAVTAAIIGIGVALFIKLYKIERFKDVENAFNEEPCALSNNGFLMEIARPFVRCDMCRHLTEVPVEREISPERFREKYAFSSVPVLIKDATKNWTAMSTFSFHYFKQLYNGVEGALDTVEEECQFFPYKTDFETLRDALNISDARANFSQGEKPWYIGWSNCDSQVSKKLREHYERPYFLPPDAESSELDWIFMGGSGLGAFIHLDYVQTPSWQAQISGRKTWTLIPVPECEDVCHAMNVTVHKGDIFVINTNHWYHATFIHTGEISITIGSEYS